MHGVDRFTDMVVFFHTVAITADFPGIFGYFMDSAHDRDIMICRNGEATIVVEAIIDDCRIIPGRIAANSGKCSGMILDTLMNEVN